MATPGMPASAARKCKSGERYISGGFELGSGDEPQPRFDVAAAGPVINNNGKAKGFEFSGWNVDTETAPVLVYAICLKK